MSKTATNAKRIALSLKRHGVAMIFGQSNPPPVTLACAAIGIKQIGYRQENAGSYMAQAAAMCSGRATVVTAQNGPAATLLVPGLGECLKASHPVVALVQDVAVESQDKNAFQELDHVQLFAGVAKWIRRIPHQKRIEDYVDMAFVAATSGRPGPAVLLLPTDLIFDPDEYPVNPARTTNLGKYPLDRNVADPEAIKEAAMLLAKAKKPLVYAGGGVIASGASGELRALQEDCALPVATTTMGKGSVDETAALTLGPIGYYMGNRGRTKFMKPLVEEADVIVLVGNRTNQNGTDAWTLLPAGAKYIHLDVDPQEIGRNYEATVRLVGDAKLSLAALREALLEIGVDVRRSARPAVEKRIAQAKKDHEAEAAGVKTSGASPIRIERFLSELDRKLSDDHILVADASISSVWLANYMTATKGRKFVFPRGLAGLGWGLPMAMGAKLVQPDRKVFCLSGDGGFAHVWSELETCVREKIDVVLAVINNGILGYQRYAEDVLFGAHTNICDLGPVDHSKVAEACGVKAIQVDSADGIAAALDEALDHKGSVVLDLIVDPKCIPPIPFMSKLDT